MPLAPADVVRYSRHLSLSEVGRAGQERLRAARVLVVGAGGLGSPAALYLAASGVGTLGIVDCDRLELSNLQRQVLFETADVGEPKVLAARRQLRALNPDIEVIAHELEVGASNVCELIRPYDIVLDGCDRLATRYVVNDACVLVGRPLVSAAIFRFEGQAMTYVPGRGPCYRCLFPDAGAAGVPNCAEAGVLGVLPGVLGVVQATEAIKLILGIGTPLVGRLLTYDALEMAFQEFTFSRRANCAVCGDRPTITTPQGIAERCEAAAPPFRRLSPAELKARIEIATSFESEPFELIDVREPDEFAAGHLPGARSVPLGGLESALAALAGRGLVVFMCRSGARSAQACTIAARHGVGGLAHLEGGLKAWEAVGGALSAGD
jgi:molybdopterin/thiamine biosynthesis adenylyltransferase/rhodanese-related sulfurtransferase